MENDTEGTSSTAHEILEGGRRQRTEAGALAIQWVFPLPDATDACVMVAGPNGEHVLAEDRVSHLARGVTSFGRSRECTVCLLPRSASATARHHADVERIGNRYVIRSRSELNFTFVNGSAIPKSGQTLAARDVVRLGDWVGVVVESEIYRAEKLVELERCFSLDAARGYPFWPLSSKAELFGGPAFAQSLLTSKRAAERAKTSPMRVLIEGETGVGKEQVARAMHEWSGRSDESYVAVVCGALEPGTAADQLFGHVAGAFTGALRKTTGLLLRANNGTIVLDDIDTLHPSNQAILHRVLQENTFMPLGESTTTELNLLAISTASVPLSNLVQSGRFRPDLLGRIAEIRIALAPLRERREDIVPLFRRFYAGYAGSALRCSAQFAEQLCLFSWPLNVRNLKAVARRLSLMGVQGALSRSDLDDDLKWESAVAERPSSALLTHSERPARGVTEPGPRLSSEALLTRAFETLRTTGDVRAAASVLDLAPGDAYRELRDAFKLHDGKDRTRVTELLRIAVEGVMNGAHQSEHLITVARAFGFPENSKFNHALDEYEKLGPEEKERAIAFRAQRKRVSSEPPTPEHER
jgi:DNA-binding NtrC family response regulator